MSRQSKRTPAPTARAVEAGIQLGRAQAAAEKPSLPGFTALAERRQREKEAAEAEKEAAEAAEEEEDVVDVEAPAAATAKKSTRARKSKKWNTCYDPTLAQMGELSRLRCAENSSVCCWERKKPVVAAPARCRTHHKPYLPNATSPLQRPSARVDFMPAYWFAFLG